jgi:hypothetical protein
MKSYSTFDLDRLQSVLNKAGISDHDIVAGIELKHVGYQRLAAKMDIRGGDAMKNINNMINELIEKMRDDQSLVAENYDHFMTEETGDKYVIEKDFLGNVTVRDTETGDENYVQGSTAAELLHALAQHGVDKQELLSHYVDDANGSVIEEEDSNSYDDEIEGASKGSYNLPWDVAGQHGTATAEYYKKGNKPVVKLVSVRDESGEEFHPPANMEAEILKKAFAFIGNA